MSRFRLSKIAAIMSALALTGAVFRPMAAAVLMVERLQRLILLGLPLSSRIVMAKFGLRLIDQVKIGSIKPLTTMVLRSKSA